MMTDHQKAQIIKLRAAGNGYGKIARTLGISLNTVKSFCRRNDINRNSFSEPSVRIHRRNDLL
jgi:DNA-binding CsgD family transcriptional regulator